MYALKMNQVTKTFGNFTANDKIDLFVKKNEIHCLLGENGSGKSTLMNLLTGIYTLDSGFIEVNNEKVKIKSPQDAFDFKMGMVYQHFKLVNTFSILENIVLGNEPTKKGKLNYKKEREKIIELVDQYKFDLNIDEKICDLTVSQEQKVEILKLLYKDLDILIFDEPTAVLTPQEIQEFLRMLKNLKKAGKTIILITHKLEEIRQIGDTCTIIRSGKFIDRVEVDKVEDQELIKKLVGQDIDLQIQNEKSYSDDVVLELKDLNFKNDRKVQKLKDINLKINRGEILGIAGIDNNGQKELADCIAGLKKKNTGEILYIDKDGKRENLHNTSIRQLNEGIISHIPEDRLKEGLIGEFNLAENSILIELFNSKFSKNGLLKKKNIASFSKGLLEKYDVRSSRGISNKARELSGGNQQKLIVGRQIELDSDIIIAFQPTRGIDVGAINFIHKKLLEEKKKGKAIILISLELSEIFALSDKISVLHHGHIIDTVKTNEVTKEDVGLLMTGKKVK